MINANLRIPIEDIIDRIKGKKVALYFQETSPGAQVPDTFAIKFDDHTEIIFEGVRRITVIPPHPSVAGTRIGC